MLKKKLNCDWASNTSLECTLLIITSGRLSFGFDNIFFLFVFYEKTRCDQTFLRDIRREKIIRSKKKDFDETVMSFAQTAA